MNIFAFDRCPMQSASWLDDIRKNKMILESAQMLSTAVRMLDPDTNLSVYKLAYINHPCSKWARASRDNFKWLLSHMSWLYNQKSGSHASARLIPELQQYAENGYFSRDELTPFANCARNLERGVDYSNVDDVHQAYRLYMNDRWRERNITLTWRWGKEPEWRA
tara:strand:- start:4240 stop:4731 length:492 start_codon:yes stop_codon:yes gene_type:complete